MGVEKKFEMQLLNVGDLNEKNIQRLSEMLSQLRVTELQKELADTLLTGMFNQGSRVFVALNAKGEICAVLTLLLEIKLLSGGCIAGHIEDVATHPDSQKQGLSSSLMQYAMDYARRARITLGHHDETCVVMKPYKIVLDCDTGLKEFYEKQGFEESGVFMRQYLRSRGGK
ncbi:MAG: GNAT family N-acetyltransferase [Candidatus Absconditabacterales bacterium]